MRERPISHVPRAALLVLALALLLQLACWYWRPAPAAGQIAIGPAPSQSSLQLISLGEPIALGKLLMLYVQAIDAQPQYISFKHLDYVDLSVWLTRILQLDPKANYPLLSAGQVYGSVGTLAQRRVMYEFIYQQFLLDPNRRWRALADAAVNARHVLKDIALAKKYTLALRLQATDKSVPIWVKQMDIFLMEDMGEVKSARILLGAMFSSGEITDPREIAFVLKRLKLLEDKEKAAQ